MTTDSGNCKISVRLSNTIERDFLLLFALEHGLKACVKPQSQKSVYFDATEQEVQEVLDKAGLGFAVLDQLILRSTAEAMMYSGSDKEQWLDAIAIQQAKMDALTVKYPHVANIVEQAKKKQTRRTELLAKAFIASLTGETESQDSD